MNMKLEVVIVPVADVDRSKRFYEKIGFRLDADVGNADYRLVQLTPPDSEASIIFGKGVTSAQPGSTGGLVLAVDDIDAARGELLSRGIEVSQLFHDGGGSLGGGFISDTQQRAPGPDPERRSYASYASFSDPDGNVWLLQEIRDRLPGREWEPKRARATDVATLAELLQETAEHHDHFEKTHAKHHWWDWYAPYLSARQSGRTSEQAAADADCHMHEVVRIARTERQQTAT
jgi:catechol 2,3-dioxygenase-like lactoylglutathione lyase family enzyme